MPNASRRNWSALVAVRLPNHRILSSTILLVFSLFNSAFPVQAQSPSWPKTEVIPEGRPLLPSLQEDTPTSSPFPQGFDDYLLAPGDRVEITVFGFEEFDGLLRVILSDGTITLPLIGSIEADGKTPEALQLELTRKLEEFLVEPLVTVSINLLRPVVVNVVGQVERPGPVQLNSLTQDTERGRVALGEGDRELPTLSSALVAAGGITKFSDIRQIVVRRPKAGGNPLTVTINFWDIITSGIASENIILQDGDTVYVPRLTADAEIDTRLLARSSLAPENISVQVVGEVRTPGEVRIPPDSNLAVALATAGGPSQEADLGNVTFVRINQEGFIERREIDLSQLNDNFQVQEGDVLLVPKTAAAKAFDTAGRASGPIARLLDIIRLILPAPFLIRD